MKKTLFLLLFLKMTMLTGQNQPPPALRSVLLEQLKSTHNQTGWFAPLSTALEGVTTEQAMWTDGSGNHSIGQLAHHLLFWNERQLMLFKGQKPEAFDGNNDETFTKFDQKTWTEIVRKLDQFHVDLEKFITTSDDAQLAKWYSTIANISTHNAYHTGQIIFVRKLQKSWDSSKGVK